MDYKKFIHSGDVLTPEELEGYLLEHRHAVLKFEELRAQYLTNPPILTAPPRNAPGKPDHRVAANFGKKLVDTFNGYFCGVPLKISHRHEKVDSLIKDFWQTNDMDDQISELAKMSSLYGLAYAYMYQNEEAETRLIYCDPFNLFLIFDDDIEVTPKYAVRYEEARDDSGYFIRGELITRTHRINFEKRQEVKFNEEEAVEHFFKVLPVIEFNENEEQTSLLEPVISLMNNYNKILSEKVNTIDTFSDAYLKVLGVEIEGDPEEILEGRVINVYDQDGVNVKDVVVEFLEKPNGDQLHENALDRFTDLIYDTSMVANITDKNFGETSGVALAYKLQAMQTLAGNKQRKFTRALNSVFENLLSIPTNIPENYADEWKGIEYTYTLNTPRNIQDEAKTVQILEGAVSKETQLKALSLIPDVRAEIEKMREEDSFNAYPGDDLR